MLPGALNNVWVFATKDNPVSELTPRVFGEPGAIELSTFPTKSVASTYQLEVPKSKLELVKLPMSVEQTALACGAGANEHVLRVAYAPPLGL